MNAPARAIIPPITQTPRINPGVCTCRATTEGLMKMPAPTIPPMTIMVAWKSPNWRASCGPAAREGAEAWFPVEAIGGRGPGRDGGVLYHSPQPPDRADAWRDTPGFESCLLVTAVTSSCDASHCH